MDYIPRKLISNLKSINVCEFTTITRQVAKKYSDATSIRMGRRNLTCCYVRKALATDVDASVTSSLTAFFSSTTRCRIALRHANFSMAGDRPPTLKKKTSRIDMTNNPKLKRFLLKLTITFSGTSSKYEQKNMGGRCIHIMNFQH